MINSKRKIGAFFVVIGLLVLSVGCEKIEKLKLPQKKAVSLPTGNVIAMVGDLYITLEQLEQEVKNYNELVTNPEAKILTREKKIAYLKEEIVRRYLLYLEAKARGLDQQQKYQEVLRNMEINVLASQFLQDEIGNLTVTSSETENFYNIYKEQFQQEEERRIREIVVDDEATAKDILIELLKGADFAALARERSKAPSAADGGDLGFIKRGKRGADFTRFDTVAFSPSLEIGQCSNFFKVKNSFYIIKLEGKKGGQVQPLSEVGDEIKRNVLFLKQQEKLEAITKGLTDKIKIVLYEDKIK